MLAEMSGIDSTVAGDVAQRVEPLVRRGDLRGLADHGTADAADLRLRLPQREAGAEAGNRLELVERAAGVAQPASRHHRDRHAARREHRRQQQRRLVSHAAGGVLVHQRPLEAVPVEPVARVEHGLGQRVSSSGVRPRQSTAMRSADIW